MFLLYCRSLQTSKNSNWEFRTSAENYSTALPERFVSLFEVLVDIAELGHQVIYRRILRLQKFPKLVLKIKNMKVQKHFDN